MAKGKRVVDGYEGPAGAGAGKGTMVDGMESTDEGTVDGAAVQDPGVKGKGKGTLRVDETNGTNQFTGGHASSVQAIPMVSLLHLEKLVTSADLLFRSAWLDRNGSGRRVYRIRRTKRSRRSSTAFRAPKKPRSTSGITSPTAARHAPLHEHPLRFARVADSLEGRVAQIGCTACSRKRSSCRIGERTFGIHDLQSSGCLVTCVRPDLEPGWYPLKYESAVDRAETRRRDARHGARLHLRASAGRASRPPGLVGQGCPAVPWRSGSRLHGRRDARYCCWRASRC